MSDEAWRIGSHYGIHVYAGDEPVATFHRAEDAARAVAAVNATIRPESTPDAVVRPGRSDDDTKAAQRL